jgi:hypothetical protein
MPWIRYKENAVDLLRKPLPQNFKLKTSFTEDVKTFKVQYLTFQLAQYNLNGTFIGFTELKT